MRPSNGLVLLGLLAAGVVLLSAGADGAGAGVGVGAGVGAELALGRRRSGHGHGHRRRHAVDRRAPDLSRYHSADQLVAKLQALTHACPHLTVGSRRGKSKSLTTVTINKTGATAKAAADKLKVLLFFGEHARELISPETALRFVQMLCDTHPDGHARPDEAGTRRILELLDNAEILLFPLINVDGHNRVTRGSYCTRTNHRGVDLNRNWDDHWKHSKRADTNSGRVAFSEDEVRILRDASHEFRPDLFISIHSGALGMYTPYAYSRARPSGRVEREMVHILKGMNPQYCNCDVGAAGKELNYLCPGTCLDYMFDVLKTPYAFAVEIWEGGYGYKKQPKTPSGYGFSLAERSATATAAAKKSAAAKALAVARARAAAEASESTAVSSSSFVESVSLADADNLNLGSCFIAHERSALRESRRHSSDVPLNTAAEDAGVDAEEGTEDAADAEEDATFVEVDADADAEAEAEAEADAETDAESEVLFPTPRGSEAHTCLSSFNPTNPTDYIATTDNWANALLELIREVNLREARAPKA